MSDVASEPEVFDEEEVVVSDEDLSASAGDLDDEEEEEYVNVGTASEVKLFGKWTFDDIEVRDISLEVGKIHILKTNLFTELTIYF